MDKFHEVRALGRTGKNKTEIAEELGIDRKTVRKYLNSQVPPRYSPRSAPSRADPFANFENYVLEKIKLAPDLSADEAYALIRPMGYQGSVRTVERRFKAWNEAKPKERFFEQAYTPGEQSQFDFKESIELPFVTGEQITHLHFGTLPFSDTCSIKGYPQKTFECFMDGVHSFFEKVGGQTANIRIDNLSPCVKKVRKDGGRDYTDAFERAIKYYGFGVLPCSPGKGNEKGDVERDIKTWSRRFKNHVKVHAIVFKDFAHLNEVLTAFVYMEIGTPKLLAQEQLALTKVLPRDESVICRVEETRASPHGTVRASKSTYSVPDEWIGLMCRVVSDPFEVRIERMGAKGSMIIHPRKAEGEHSIKLEHVLKSLLRKPQAMVRWAHREILFPESVFRDLYRRLKAQAWPSPGHAEREYLRIMNLVHHVPLCDIKCALDIVLEADEQEIFSSVKDLLLTERRPPAEIVDLARFAQVPLSPNLEAYDQLIPAAQ